MKESYQKRTHDFMVECFGPEVPKDKLERAYRFIEEAHELAQAVGMTRAQAHELVNYTWGREVGDIANEIGGVYLTLSALCNALDGDMDMVQLGEAELKRVYTIIPKIRAKQLTKPKASPLPGAGLYNYQDWEIEGDKINIKPRAFKKSSKEMVKLDLLERAIKRGALSLMDVMFIMDMFRQPEPIDISKLFANNKK